MRRTKTDMALIRFLTVGIFLLGVLATAPTAIAQFKDVTPKEDPPAESEALEEPAAETDSEETDTCFAGRATVRGT